MDDGPPWGGAGKRVWICVGAGGVGKTTISAALALGLAARGRRALVVSIDPARRLAGALGLEQLPGEPHRIDSQALAAALEAAGEEAGALATGMLEGRTSGTRPNRARGSAPAGGLEGELWAMVLDPKRTFDTLIERLAPDERAREEVLSNRIYRELSTATAGSQEFTAVAKLFELEREGGFDAIVLDTPPSRNALDFLDAPDRMRGFLEGRALRVLLRPGWLGGSLLGRGSGLVLAVLGRATGVDLLQDLSKFFGSLGGVLDGISERARAVERLLRDPCTSFVIVSSPEPEPVREAQFLHAHLREAGMPFGGVVMNRVHDTGLDGEDPDRLPELLSGLVEEGLVVKLVENLAELELLARHDRESVERVAEGLAGARPLLVSQLDGEVQDLAGLARIAGHLFA